MGSNEPITLAPDERQLWMMAFSIRQPFYTSYPYRDETGSGSAVIRHWSVKERADYADAAILALRERTPKLDAAAQRIIDEAVALTLANPPKGYDGTDCFHVPRLMQAAAQKRMPNDPPTDTLTSTEAVAMLEAAEGWDTIGGPRDPDDPDEFDWWVDSLYEWQIEVYHDRVKIGSYDADCEELLPCTSRAEFARFLEGGK